MSCVAILKDEIIGAVLCSHDGRRGYLHNLAVKKQYRKKGIGSKQVDYCLKKLLKDKVIKCNIFIIEKNELGIIFWKKRGFNLFDHYGWLQKQLK